MKEVVFQQLEISRRQLYCFYQAAIFAHSLTQCCRAHEPGRTPDITPEFPRTAGEEKGFFCYANKLCFTCDNEPGGSKMTSLAVLQAADSIVYLFASNDRDEEELGSAKVFLEALFDKLRIDDISMSLKSERDKLYTSLQQHILSFNKTRVMCYLNGLCNELRLCLDSLNENEQKEARILAELFERAWFLNRKGLDQTEWLKSTGILISILEEHQKTGVLEFVNERAKASSHDPSGFWPEARHFIGRLRSYGSAVRIILDARQTWPKLFRNNKILFIPSSTPLGNPFPVSKRNCTARDIIGKLVPAEETTLRRRQANRMQKFELDTKIHQSCHADSFDPCVHAEIMVFDILERAGYLRPEHFFNGWMYIGGSKPTCHLCSSYLTAHPANVKFRPSHGTIYTAWRVPDTYGRSSEASSEAEDIRLMLFRKIMDELREICKRILSDQEARSRKHDSLTYSSTPSCWDNLNRGLSMIEEIGYKFGNLSLGASFGTHNGPDALHHGRGNHLVPIQESGYGEKGVLGADMGENGITG